MWNLRDLSFQGYADRDGVPNVAGRWAIFQLEVKDQGGITLTNNLLIPRTILQGLSEKLIGPFARRRPTDPRDCHAQIQNDISEINGSLMKVAAPLKLRLDALREELEALEELTGAAVGKCEGCKNTVFTGDKIRREDGENETYIFCEDCSPTVEDEIKDAQNWLESGLFADVGFDSESALISFVKDLRLNHDPKSKRLVTA